MRRAAVLARSVTLLFIAAAFLSSSGCARFAAPNKKLKRAVYNPEGIISKGGQYVIGVRDEIEVAVWRCPELYTKATVRPEDGKISIPLIGDVQASGLTSQELADAIGEKLAYFVKEPSVAVRVLKLGEKKVYLLGQTLIQGAFRIDKGDRVIDVVAKGGGFNDNALASCAYIIRGGYDNNRIIRINLARLIVKGDTSQNVLLEEGDIVYIPIQEIENLNYGLRKIFPSMYFAERLGQLQQNIMQGQYDWHAVWMKMSGKGVWKD